MTRCGSTPRTSFCAASWLLTAALAFAGLSGCSAIASLRESLFGTIEPGSGGLAPGATATTLTPVVLGRPLQSAVDPAPAATPTHVVVVGDTGENDADQWAVAKAMYARCRAERCDAFLHAGDIIYPSGIRSKHDPVLRSHFVEQAVAVGAPTWLTLGNHDYQGSPDAWIDAFGDAPVAGAPDVHFPARYYTTTLAGIRLVAIDTNRLDESQGRWLDSVLAESTHAGERWVIVLGHHPWISGGRHGDAPREVARWYASHLCGKVDVFFAGHDHDKQILRPECDILLVVTGAGSKLRAVSRTDRTLFVASTLGFADFVLAGDDATLRFYDVQGRAEIVQPLQRRPRTGP